MNLCPSAKIKKILANEYGIEYVINTEKSGNPSIQDILKEDSIVFIKGRISIRDDDDVSILADQVKAVDDESSFEEKTNTYYEKTRSIKHGTGKKLFLRVDSMKNEELLNEIYSVIRNNQGIDPVVIYPLDENQKGEKKTYQLSGLGVYADINVASELEKIME